jgi:hypothetical protein
MAKPDFYTDTHKVKTTSSGYKRIDNELTDLYSKWAKLSEEIEKLVHGLK